MTRPWSELHGNRRASIAVEAAVIASVFLVPLICGLAGAGQAIALQTRLDRALHAAMFYVWATPGASAASVQNAAQAGFGTDTLTGNVATVACYCMAPDGTRASAGAAVTCSTVCSSGLVLATFVTTTVSATVALVLPMPAVTLPWTLASSATIRSN